MSVSRGRRLFWTYCRSLESFSSGIPAQSIWKSTVLMYISYSGRSFLCASLLSYQLQQAQYQSRTLSDYVISFTAELHEAVQTLRLLPPACDEVLHLRCENKGWSVPVVASEKVITLSLSERHRSSTHFLLNSPFKACKHLCVAHDFAKVNMEHVSSLFQHDVVVVAVTDPQDEGGHTPPCT